MANVATTKELISLLQAAKSGDKAAFSAIYSSFYLPIFRYCNKRLRHTGDAEDVTQQVFLRLYTSRTTFTDQDISPLNYLYTVARTTVIDFWHKQNKSPDLLPEDFDIADNNNHEKVVLSRVTAEQVLQMVSAEEKEILTLRLLEGFSSREVAERLQKSEASVRQIQCRALKKIRDAKII